MGPALVSVVDAFQMLTELTRQAGKLARGFSAWGEWWEYQTSRLDIESPDLPDWGWLEPLGRGLFWLFIAALTLWIVWLLYRAVKTLLDQRDGTPVAPPFWPR